MTSIEHDLYIVSEIHFLVNPDSHVQNIYNALAARAGFCPESFGLLYDGQRLLPDRKIESYGVCPMFFGWRADSFADVLIADQQ